MALHVTRKLKNMGSWVWQMQRTDVRRSEIERMMAIVAKGDALNKADVQKVFDGEQAGACKLEHTACMGLRAEGKGAAWAQVITIQR